MPIVPFDTLPDASRVWVFASDRALSGASADTLLAAVDQFLAGWRAHGVPLHCARAWRDDRFLAVGVDVNAEHASGCSIDGLFRALQDVQREIGAQLVGGGRVFYKNVGGDVATATRAEFAAMAKRGEVTPATPVFDTSVADAAAWRTRFEQAAASTWTSGCFAPTTGSRAPSVG